MNGYRNTSPVAASIAIGLQIPFKPFDHQHLQVVGRLVEHVNLMGDAAGRRYCSMLIKMNFGLRCLVMATDEVPPIGGVRIQSSPSRCRRTPDVARNLVRTP